jgi:hypothetical protein
MHRVVKSGTRSLLIHDSMQLQAACLKPMHLIASEETGPNDPIILMSPQSQAFIKQRRYSQSDDPVQSDQALARMR